MKLYEVKMSMSISKVLLEHNHVHSAVSDCMYLNDTHRDHMTHRPEVFIIWLFTNQLADPRSSGMVEGRGINVVA